MKHFKGMNGKTLIAREEEVIYEVYQDKLVPVDEMFEYFKDKFELENEHV